MIAADWTAGDYDRATRKVVGMSDRWQAWAAGAAVVLGIGAWLWWQSENPALMDGTYDCEGHTVQTDGARSLIDAKAEVVDGKIRPGQTGADIALGHRVMVWGDVEKSSQTEFLVEITPEAEIRQVITEPFWITCRHR